MFLLYFYGQRMAIVFLFCNLLIILGCNQYVYEAYQVCVCRCVLVCAQKLFHYSAQLMLLQCVSSFNLIIPSYSLYPFSSFSAF